MVVILHVPIVQDRVRVDVMPFARELAKVLVILLVRFLAGDGVLV